jgi:hypothetical protein
LNGFFVPAGGPIVLVSDKAGLAVNPAEEGIGEVIDPNAGENVSDIGERLLRLRVRYAGGPAREVS